MTADLENRCVDIIGKLWNVDAGRATGTSTVGSSSVHARRTSNVI